MPTDRPGPSVVFLDVDGVLNTPGSWRGGKPLFDPSPVANFNRIMHATEADVVISSSWRYLMATTGEWEAAMTRAGFEYMLRTHGLAVASRVVGCTPLDEQIEGRGRQIRAWMNEHGDGRPYVVIDDLDLGITDERHPFVQTDGSVGLTAEDAELAIGALTIVSAEVDPWSRLQG